jgi:hypothetical protein
MIEHSEREEGSQLWVAILTGTSAAATLAFACATPFAALAAFAATRMSTRTGFMLMALTWAVSQAIGFLILGYPHDPKTLTWGFAILTAALAGVAAARWGAGAVTGQGAFMRQATAFGTGFVGYKAVLLVWSLGLGGVHTALSPYWTSRQFGTEALILVGLVALYHVLTAAGVPTLKRFRIA